MTVDARTAVAALASARDIEDLEAAIKGAMFLDDVPGEDRQKLRGEIRAWALVHLDACLQVLLVSRAWSSLVSRARSTAGSFLYHALLDECSGEDQAEEDEGRGGGQGCSGCSCICQPRRAVAPCQGGAQGAADHRPLLPPLPVPSSQPPHPEGAAALCLLSALARQLPCPSRPALLPFHLPSPLPSTTPCHKLAPFPNTVPLPIPSSLPQTYDAGEFEDLVGKYEELKWRIISKPGGATVKPDDFYVLYGSVQVVCMLQLTVYILV